MKENLKLYICGKEVEFSTGPKIVYNYKETDLRNPTIVKNSYSKQIEIPGTEKNNDLFGHIWDLERTQYEGGVGGASFNPMKKAPFELYVNGEIVEKGYAKLDSVKREDRAMTYSVHLYGGLGSFFYNLSYDEASEDDRKKNLADLHYYFYDSSSAETEVGFTISKDTVLEAWEYIIGSGGIITDDPTHSPTQEYGDQWDLINFVPAYNGIPEDFSADKVLVNHSGITLTAGDHNLIQYDGNNGAVIGPTVYTTATGRGFTMFETKEGLTEWETKDLRSYLQRPAINVNKVLKAIFHPLNNGGYQVKLGNHFFHDGNPYWNWRSWMTLPMLKELDIKGGETETISGATLTKESTNRWIVSYGTTLAELNSARIRINPNIVATSTTPRPLTANKYYSHLYWESKNGFTLKGNTYVKNLTCGDGAIIQMLARNANGDLVAQSKAYVLSNSLYAADGSTPIYKYFWKDGDEGTEPEYEFVPGYWSKVGNDWVFYDINGNKKSIEFTLPQGMAITSIEFKTQMQNSHIYNYKAGGSSSVGFSRTTGSTFFSVFSNEYKSGNFGLKTVPEVMTENNSSSVELNLVLENFEGVTTDYEAMFSNTYIPKEKLLSTPFTPADFLLSYAKTFGLYFHYDPTEQSDDASLYPSGVIHIMDREDFFTDEVIDLEEYIDRSREMTITPTLAQSKFYNFEQEPVDSEVNEDYQNTYGHNYGRQLVNTGYNFDSNVSNLYDGNVFKAAVMVTEKDKYFKGIDSKGYQPFISQGGQQILFGKSSVTSTGPFNGQTFPRDVDQFIASGANLNPLGYEYYDLMPKMQFHTAENKASDGAYVLCFYDLGPNNQGIECEEGGHYILTDDLQEMVLYNDGEPCWIMSKTDTRYNNVRICWHINRLPYFTRDIVAVNQMTGPIIHSWNFGHTKITFSPEVYTTEGDCIYDVFWKKYIRDLYDVNGRKLSCYVRLEDRPNGEAMRKFYWFDNSIWRLNEVKDWNVFGFDSTLCEFVKVQDMDNYKLDQVYSDMGWYKITITPEVIPYTGGTVYVNIEMQDCGSWYIRTGQLFGVDGEGNTYELTPVPSGAEGCRSQLAITVPSTTANTDISWRGGIEFHGGHVLPSGIKFTQERKPYINAKWPATATYNGQSHVITVTVDSNVTWTVDSNSAWCRVRKDSDTQLTINMDQNQGIGTRAAKVTVSGNGVTSSHSFTQAKLNT